MPQSAEAVLEMIVKGQREAEEAFSKVGDKMKEVADRSEVVSSRMSRMGQGIEIVQKNLSKLTMAAASFGAIAWSLNKIQKEYAASTEALRFAIEMQGIAWTEAEMQHLQPLIVAFSKVSGISIPELQGAITELLPFTGDAASAFDAVRIAADLAARQGKPLSFGLGLVKGILSGDEGTVIQFQKLDKNISLTNTGMENLAIIASHVAGAAERLATPLDKLWNQFNQLAAKIAEFNEKLGGIPVLVMGVIAGLAGLVVVLSLIASPIGLIVLGITALVVALILLWQNWETIWGKIKEWTATVMNALENSVIGKIILWFTPVGLIIRTLKALYENWDTIWTAIKNAVMRVWNGIRLIFEGVIMFITGIFTNDWQKAWDGLAKIFSGFGELLRGVWDTIIGVFKAGLNIVITMINQLIRAINSLPNFQIPSWVPGIGGQSWGIPDIPEIPRLQHGTASFRGGAAIVGEAGPELVSLPRGAQVTPMGGMQRIVIYLDSRVIAEAVIPHWTEEVRLQGV